MRKAKNIFANIDITTIILFLLLVIFGWFNIYASQYNDDTNFAIDFSSRYGKQFYFIIISFVVALIILIIDWKFYYSLSYIIYFLIILCLCAVLIMGSTTNGAISWFQIGNIKIQPSELAKFATALALAKFLNMQHFKEQKIGAKLFSYLIIFLPTLLIILQNDLGTALIFSSFILVLYREGLSINILFFILILSIICLLSLLINKMILVYTFSLIAVLTILFFRFNKKDILTIISIWILSIFLVMGTNHFVNNILSEHHTKRINILLGKEFDPYGAGYNLIQSKIAIGSGGGFGKGFLNGTQTRFDFVPEQSTDFIFCTIGEEWGFLGSLIFIFLFTSLISRIIILSERQRSSFSRVYGYGVACILFFHFIINVGMTIGLLPTVGIPLPFISYGGSSLIGFTVLLFVFLNLDSYRLEILR
tara:strand:- start:2165 stop:3427 length:1263 start_codon:yes stop_codon:yes gene_type:complete